jgi:hypothetical protein
LLLLHRQLQHSSALLCNVHDPASQDGNLPIDAAVVQFTPLPQNPSNEKEFLRYLKASPLTDKGSPGVPARE